jgi:hypothetical protein
MDEVVRIGPLASEPGLIGYEVSSLLLRDKRGFAAEGGHLPAQG